MPSLRGRAHTTKLASPQYGDGRETGVAVIGMGKLGGEELNYSSDIDLMFVYGAEGDTAGGPDGAVANGEFFARVCREIVAYAASLDEAVVFTFGEDVWMW